jgi:hypothetical protein
MSLRVSLAAVRTYDALKRRPGARPRQSDARDTTLLKDVEGRILQFVHEYQINGSEGMGGFTYVFWSEVEREISAGRFDDLLDRL